MVQSAKEQRGLEKLVAFRKIRNEIKRIEQAAIADWVAVSLETIRKLPTLLSEVDASISRLEAGSKRKKPAVVENWGA